MENFVEFEIGSQEFIFGGKIVKTEYTARDGKTGKDSYDSEKNSVKYLT